MTDQQKPQKAAGPRKRLNQSLPDPLHRKLKERAAREGVPLHVLVERMLDWAADRKLDARATA